MAPQDMLTPRAATTTTASGSPTSGGLWTIFGSQWAALSRRPIKAIPLQRAGFGGGIYRHVQKIREANSTQMEVQHMNKARQYIY